jgi:serine/threonine-protein kinase
VSAAEGGHGEGTAVPQSTALGLQCFLSIAGTMVGEALGDTLLEKLGAGLLLCVVGAFLSAPGRHHRRRVVAVTLLLALLELLRRAAGALAHTRRKSRPAPSSGMPVPASWATIGLVSLVGFGLGSLGTTATGGWPDDDPATVAVPAVAGASEAGARARMKQAGLAATRSTAASATVRRGFAIRTVPAAGAAVRPGSSVALYVSSGAPPSRLSVPAVRGLAEREARFVLEDLGLRVARDEAPSAQIARGRATGTSPPADARVRSGARVTLFVSGGPPADERVAVPRVAGSAERVALRRLRAAGLDPLARPTPSEDVAAGIAIGTEPTAGARVERGARVRLLVSSGSQVERVSVPALTGTSIAVARARLDALGLRSQTATEGSSEPEGTVVRSDPAAGTSVAVGTEVRLIVSNGSLVRVPDVVGMALDDARTALKRAGLGSTQQFVDSTQPQETVIRTDPAAGSEVPRGTVVSVQASCGSDPCVQVK